MNPDSSPPSVNSPDFPFHQYQKLEKRKSEGAFRSLRTYPEGHDFISNDYLGMASPTEKKTDVNTSMAKGSGGSRLISGHFAITAELETFIARFHQSETALLFNSGYDANIGIASCLPGRNDIVLYDELSHASIIDGLRMGLAKSYKFRHNNSAHLQELITRHADAPAIFIFLESLYSMDGDFAPLEEMLPLKQKNCYFIIDEAHTGGWYGTEGEGYIAHHGLENQVFARIITYGKAFGRHGAAIMGSQPLRDYLINFSRSFIFTTALPPAALQSIYDAYVDPQRKIAIPVLKQRINLFKSLLPPGIPCLSDHGPIQCILCPGNEKADALALRLETEGIWVKAVKSPTVPEGKERIRICLHSFNTEKEIQTLCKVIGDFFKS